MGLEGGGTEEKEKKEEEKVSHMCESIGHRLLRGRCPKVRKRAYPALPTRPRLVAVYPALFFNEFSFVLSKGNDKMIKDTRMEISQSLPRGLVRI